MLIRVNAGSAVKAAALSSTRADAEHRLLVEGAADELQAERQAVVVRPAGTEMRRQAREVEPAR